MTIGMMVIMMIMMMRTIWQKYILKHISPHGAEIVRHVNERVCREARSGQEYNTSTQNERLAHVAWTYCDDASDHVNFLLSRQRISTTKQLLTALAFNFHCPPMAASFFNKCAIRRPRTTSALNSERTCTVYSRTEVWSIAGGSET